MESRTCPLTAGNNQRSGPGKTAKKQRFHKRTGLPGKGKGSFIVLLLLLLAFLPSSFLDARQDSARLSFQKTIGRGAGKVHVVKKGESLLLILKKIPGGKPVSLSLVRRLNPGLRDINKIYPGQKIVLPSSEQADIPLANTPPQQQNGEKLSPYLIKENDSISRILLAELKPEGNGRQLTPEETIETYRNILKLNPDITDMNNLPAGRTLLLPAEMIRADGAESKQSAKETPAAKTHPALQTLLLSIRPVIEGMKGSLNTAGSYFIPLQDATQISIDSSLIPSVELDDGTIVFLDYENILPNEVRQLIHQYWRSYYFLTNLEMQNAAETLREIIGHAQNYRMTRVEKPLLLTAKPEIAVSPDWIISGNRKTDGSSYRQGIFLLALGEQPLPEAAKLFLEQNGLAVTQITKEKILPHSPPDNLQIVREDLSGLQGIALAEKLLKALGEPPHRKAEVAIFKQAENGFNLSITADLLLRKGEQKLILHSKKLPDQFMKILNNSGFELLTIGENDKGRSLIEAVLRGAGLSASFDYFSSRIPKEGVKSRLDISFSAISSVKDGEQIYLTDFDLPAWILPIIFNGPKVLVIRY